MTFPLLSHIVTLLVVCVGVLIICQQLRLPAIVAFMISGVLVGPHGFGIIPAEENVEILAEIGVILLLFSIGIEFSLERLARLKRRILVGGPLQVGLTIFLVWGVFYTFGFGIRQAVFIGFLVSLSSTAIVLSALQAQDHLDAPHGRTALAILIFQDVIIVVMMLLTPFLAAEAGPLGVKPFIALILKGTGIVVFTVIAAKYLVPYLMGYIAGQQNRELFILAIIAICFAVAWGTSQVGLSLALGAFLAGLIISESEYSHQALTHVIPFRDVFSSFFFVSIGMLMNVEFFVENLIPILLLTSLVIVGKFTIAAAATLIIQFPLRTAVIAGLTLAQIGEFSFVLAEVGRENGLLSPQDYQYFISISVLSMALTPLLMRLGPFFADTLISWRPLEKLHIRLRSAPTTPDMGGEITHSTDHLVVAGYGVSGRNIVAAAKEAAIACVTIEMNPKTVRKEIRRGEAIIYGDASQELVLQQAGIEEARMLVITVPDEVEVRRVVAMGRALRPDIYIIARTRYFREIQQLKELGCDEVFSEEIQASFAMFDHILSQCMVPREKIRDISRHIQQEAIRGVAGETVGEDVLTDLPHTLSKGHTVTVMVEKGSFVEGKTPSCLQLHKCYEVKLLALRRGGDIIPNPNADMRFRAGDAAILFGNSDKTREAEALFRSGNSA